MTDRVSERIWRAAQAHWESRMANDPWQLWKGLRQERRDIEYDAMVAAFEAVDALWIAVAGGGLDPAEVAMVAARWGEVEEQSAPQRVVEAVAQSIFDRAEHVEKAEARIAELEAVERELRTALGSAINDRDGFWKERDRLRTALMPFAAYAERIEKERAELASMAPTGIAMSWFIAALKAYRGEDSKTEDKT